MHKSIAILLGSFLLLFNCASTSSSHSDSQETQETPGWITTAGQEYPSSFYITGVGINPELDAAKQQAKAEVAAQIRSTVQSEITDIEQEISVEGETTSRSDITQKIREITDVTVSGITYPRTDNRNGQYYVLAVLDKQQYLRDIQMKLDDQVSELVDLRSSIDAQLDRGGLLTSLENFDALSDQLEEFVSLRSIFNAVSSSAYANTPEFTLNAIWTELVAHTRTVDISIISGANQSANLGAPLARPVTARITYQRAGSRIPAIGIPVEFRNSDGSVITRKSTDDNGEASVSSVSAIPGESPNRGRVEAGFGSMPFPVLRQNLRMKSAGIEYGINQPSYTFAVQIVPAGKSNTFTETLRKGLSALGYSLQDEAPVILRANLSVSNSREVSGFAGKQYLA
ncbi:MAG TPA: LPP20 family lipoprotein, partial [bacterium]|nr:LPP20 family lipoprotein [bacterium]